MSGNPVAVDRWSWYIIHTYSGFEAKVKESLHAAGRRPGAWPTSSRRS